MIGEIIDEFVSIGTQISLRCGLGLTDLNVFSENYIRDLLNIINKTNLHNLNDERSNEPGLDLGDEKAKVAFQITSTASAAKVNKTLGKITDDHRKKYKKIYVFILGAKQGSYRIDAGLAKKSDFLVENIMDFDDLARLAIALPIERLELLHREVRKNSTKLKLELEFPDMNGRFKNNNYDRWEAIQKPKFGTGERFAKFLVVDGRGEIGSIHFPAIGESIKEVAHRLSKLPRMTREFLAMLYEHREKTPTERNKRDAYDAVLLAKIKRLYADNDYLEEIALLEHEGFTWIDGEDPESYGPPAIIIKLSKSEDLQSSFVDYVSINKLSYRKIIGEIDFSDF